MEISTKDRREEFLKELALLTQKHGFVIEGPGEWDAPIVRELTESELGPYGYVCDVNGHNLEYTARP